jgi:thioredoxin-like negative regulator of GroEL
MERIRTDEAFREAIANNKPTVVVFKTTWCKDCHYIEPFMPDIEQAYADRLNLYEIDRDDMEELCSELNILGIPSFIGFKGGKELGRFVSKLRKTREEIESFLDGVIDAAAKVQA